MGKEQGRKKTEYNFDRLLRSSFGRDDDQLLEQMKIAEETVDDSQIPPRSEERFKQMMEEVNKRGIKPRLMADKNDEEEEKNTEEGGKRRPRCLGPLIRVALAVGILASVLLMSSIQAGAKRSYEYEKSERVNERNDMAVNNEDNKTNEDELDAAYKRIHEEIGINVLMLGERPKDFLYLNTAINNRHATMYFQYCDNWFEVVQQLRTVENSFNIKSDRGEAGTVYNEWLDKNILIEKAVTENNEEEYSAQINEDNAYYYLSGIMEKKVFEKLIEDVRFME